ncbi:hypothetical protein NA56DRAFT_756665 [Hyaloscypha hepaticicola]|uniref:Apple domain-containing protein n=1 Tax=Hyaloscypha hepaticicola TaxID=2082293 RepID=A0A2J6PE94_9HELO|nr:hypothetical protein NA56DRAFT_756665 [Hyaloscypha hepaticicola]
MLSKNLFLSVSTLLGLAQGAVLLEERTNGCNADNCLRALLRYSAQAVPFCSSYISIPVVTVTVTGSATATQTATITIPTTAFATATSVTVVDVTTTVSAPIIAPRDVVFGQFATVAARDAPLPTYVSQYPASRVSSACSCLSVTPSTRTISTTITSTASTTLSVTSTETDTVTTTTTSYDTVATVTVNNLCSVGYNAAGNGEGNVVVRVTATSAADCCAQCQIGTNCVANAYVGGICQLLTRSTTAGSLQITNQCPLGTTMYSFGNPAVNGIVFAGPCGVN